jgi:DNA-binding response OmpR family regulator
MRELLARIRALLKRTLLVPATGGSSVLQYADLILDMNTKTAPRGGTAINLTPKEFKLLAYMLQNTGRVLSCSEIAEKVWDTHFDTGTNLIDVYINYLRKKVDKDFEPKLIHTRPGMGFILTNIQGQ